MASLRTAGALGFGMRTARVLRFLIALGAISFLAIATAPNARAQFVCDGPNPSAANVTCTNTMSAGGFFAATSSSGNATSVNTNTGTASLVGANSTNGDALTNNAGVVILQTDTEAFDGNATTINAATGVIGVQINTFAQSSVLPSVNATTYNYGTVGGFITTQTYGGNATTVNSGSVLSLTPGGSGITTTTDFFGDALTINTSTGNVFGGITTATGYIFGTGNATTVNAGVADFVTTYTSTAGNAVSINTGTLTNPSGNASPVTLPPGYESAMLTLAVGTGDATAINRGTIASSSNNPSIVTVTDTGNASAINYGTTGGIYTLSGYNGGGGNADISNYGTSSTGIAAVAAGDGNASVYNAGRSFGGLSAQAFGFGAAAITNSGFVDGTSTSGVAIALSQFSIFTPTTLNILPGSRIIGRVQLNGNSFFPGTGTQVNIFGGADISSTLKFGGGCICGSGGLFDTGATVNIFGGAPYVLDYANNIVSVLDPTSFALQDRNVTEFSHTIASMVTSRLNNPAPISGGSSVSSFAPSGSVAADMARDAFAGISSLNYASNDRVLFSNPSITAADGTSVWAQGFAGQRIQDASAPVLRSVNNFYGGMLGIDKAVRRDLRVGVLLGAGNIKSTIDLNSGDTSSDIVFGGVYGRYAMNRSFFDFSLIGGHGSNDLRRNMANNLAPNGLETATASYASWFVSPEIAYGVRKDIWPNVTLTPTGRVRYVAAGFDGYQESGSTTNLTVASRTSHNFEERAELTLTRTSDPVPTQRMQVSGTIGALALQRAGDTTVNTILLGQNLPFATPGKNDIYGIYSGVGFDWRNNKGVTVFGAAEYTATTDASRTATAKGGVRFVF